ncbi:glycerate kinase [Allobacillus sp. GCM10007491]|uniref:Glycerate kinase n=1 Tax=Allobacillus saliphilus TaxID=2912308 RepID=A0A941HST7_9BACI|nr:glycerate kinase [Allobacillus saliphilus]MBR7552579.1 glycerate kinase [Allobacillus saliphilus]
MKIVLAPDSFKGSLSSSEVTQVMERAIKDVDHSYTVVSKPMADGGEGTIEAMLTSRKGKIVNVQCTGPLGEPIKSSYIVFDSNEAVIELAEIAGLTLVPTSKRNPDYTTTYGLGEVILDAIDRGAKSIMIGLGGSATNDGGLGMLIALGMKARDKDGQPLSGYGLDLHHVHGICFEDLDKRLKDVDINVACDVTNPLCGARGASVVFGPQKGATDQQVKQYDQSLHQYAKIIEDNLGQSYQNIPGAGAAGGLGFALLMIGGQLESGAQQIGEAIHLEKEVQEADLVITGEGQSDEQTLYGKAPCYVASIANKHRVPVVLLSGSLSGEQKSLNDLFTSCFSIVNRPLTLGESMNEVETLLYEQTIQIIKLVGAFSKR